MQSICPSQTIASWRGDFAIAAAARSKPKSGEADHPPLPVADREHEPPGEAVISLVARARRRAHHAGRLELLRRVAILLGPLEDRRRAGRRVADRPRLLRLVAQVARGEVLARGRRLLRLHEAAAVERGELGHQRVEALAQPRLRVLALLDLNPALRRQLAHRLDEGEPLHLLDELDGVARLPAAEAVVEALRLVDVEGRSLLVVEGTARLLRRAGLAHRDAVGRNELGEVNPLLDLLHRRVWYAPCH